MASAQKTDHPAAAYFGSTISLTSKAGVRYEGFLYTIDPQESSVALSQVKIKGTEGRPNVKNHISASDEEYEFIIFRATDIAELLVLDTPPLVPLSKKPVDDPAIMRIGCIPKASAHGVEPLRTGAEQLAQQRRGNSRDANRNVTQSRGRGGFYVHGGFYDNLSQPNYNPPPRGGGGGGRFHRGRGPPGRFNSYSSGQGFGSSGQGFGSSGQGFGFGQPPPRSQGYGADPFHWYSYDYWNNQAPRQSQAYHQSEDMRNRRPQRPLMRFPVNRRNSRQMNLLVPGYPIFSNVARRNSRSRLCPEDDYDFESANKELAEKLEELNIEDSNLSNQADESRNEQSTLSVTESTPGLPYQGYNKEESFYDNISRAVGRQDRDAQREKERQQNTKDRLTFGARDLAEVKRNNNAFRRGRWYARGRGRQRDRM